MLASVEGERLALCRSDIPRSSPVCYAFDGALGNLRASCHVRDGPQDAECLRPIQHRLRRRSARGGAEDANRSGEKPFVTQLGHDSVTVALAAQVRVVN